MNPLMAVLLAALISNFACALDILACALSQSKMDPLRIVVLGPLLFVLVLAVMLLPS